MAVMHEGPPAMSSPRPTTVRASALAFAALAAASITIGCGGDSEDDPGAATNGATASEPVTDPQEKERWLARADEICAAREKKIDKAVDRVFRAPSPSDEELDRLATERLAPTVQSEIDEIRELPPPAGDEEEIARILDSAQEGIDQIEAKGGLIVQGGGPFIEANLLAKEYGLRKCGWV
jgi:hypothetical protein